MAIQWGTLAAGATVGAGVCYFACTGDGGEQVVDKLAEETSQHLSETCDDILLNADGSPAVEETTQTVAEQASEKLSSALDSLKDSIGFDAGNTTPDQLMDEITKTASDPTNTPMADAAREAQKEVFEVFGKQLQTAQEALNKAAVAAGTTAERAPLPPFEEWPQPAQDAITNFADKSTEIKEVAAKMAEEAAKSIADFKDTGLPKLLETIGLNADATINVITENLEMLGDKADPKLVQDFLDSIKDSADVTKGVSSFTSEQLEKLSAVAESMDKGISGAGVAGIAAGTATVGAGIYSANKWRKSVNERRAANAMAQQGYV